MENLSQFKCPTCGAPLAWSPKLKKLHCAACGNSFEADGSLPGSRDVEEVSSFNWGAYKEGLTHEKLDNTAVYTCVSCGAEIEADLNTVATKCPYCDNNVVLNDKVSGSLRPNGVIPFRITPEELPDAVQRFYKGKHLLPRGFFSARSMGKVQGIYVPFWLYDCHIEGPMNLQGALVRTYREGEYECTETMYYLLERDGEMRFSRIPVDGSVRMDDDLMDSIEPFDYSELKAFRGEYLTGYLADRFDDDPDACLPRASKRVMNSATDVMKGTCPGFSQVSFVRNGMQITDASVRYVLLPVYLFHCEYGGKKYRYAVNGQTGKVVGELPISRGKSAAAFAGVFAGVSALLSLLLTKTVAGDGLLTLLSALLYLIFD